MYQNESNEIEFVRNTILVNQFYKIVMLCGDDCPIVPLKGISLLFTIYKDDYERNVADIDFFVAEENVPSLVEKLENIGYRFRKNSSNLKVRINAKHKFDMVHSDNRFCDLDIHTNLINKKFYRTTTGDFTSFALSRLHAIEHNDKSISLLSPVDEWLYLAQHYCFHLFSNDKWLKDLYLLQRCFSDEEITELVAIAKKFHFERVVTAVSRCLAHKHHQDSIKIPELVTKKHFIFDSLLRNLRHQYSNKFFHRIVAVYWEFIFIDNSLSRLKAYLRLLFPRLNVLSAIYNCFSKMICFMYPVHLLVVILSSILFLPIITLKKF